MSKRKIIRIDDAKCNGCGLCIPNCPEGALQIIDGKARLVSDLFCDGLGACLGACPQGAISVEERQAEAYDERKVMENIIPQGPNVIKAHLKHLKDHNQETYLKEAVTYLEEKGIRVFTDPHPQAKGFAGCPGSRAMEFSGKDVARPAAGSSVAQTASRLSNWPVQLMLVPVQAPFFENSDLLIAADCVPFSYADFHEDLLRGRVLLVGCPKLDDVSVYREKLTQIIENNTIRSITYAHMEVPCCFGMLPVIKEAIEASKKQVVFREAVIGIKGERIK